MACMLNRIPNASPVSRFYAIGSLRWPNVVSPGEMLKKYHVKAPETGHPRGSAALCVFFHLRSLASEASAVDFNYVLFFWEV